MKVHHVLVCIAVLSTVSVASAGQRWELQKTAADTHKRQSEACYRANQFAETTLLAQCHEANGKLTIVEGEDCKCESHGEFTCVATAHGYCER